MCIKTCSRLGTVRNTLRRLVPYCDGQHSIFAQLPNELVHEIFHLAALSSSQAAQSLCGVSSWARRLAIHNHLPTVSIETVEGLDWFMSCPLTCLPDSWVHPLFSLRHLWIDAVIMLLVGRDPKTFMLGIMERCPNISSLAVTGECFLTLVESKVDVPWARRETDLEVKTFGGRDLERDLRLVVCSSMQHGYDHPILSRVTRLTVDDIEPHLMELFDVQIFPRLRQLAVSYMSPSPSYARTLLRRSLSLDRLEMVVVIAYRCCGRDILASFEGKDSRVRVHCPLIPSESRCTSEAWKLERAGGKDVWALAVSDFEWDCTVTQRF